MFRIDLKRFRGEITFPQITHWAVRCDTIQIDPCLKTNSGQLVGIPITTINFQCVDSAFIRRLKSASLSLSIEQGSESITRDGPMIIQTHRDNDMSSFASRPQETDLNRQKTSQWPFSLFRAFHYPSCWPFWAASSSSNSLKFRGTTKQTKDHFSTTQLNRISRFMFGRQNVPVRDWKLLAMDRQC